MAVQTHRDKVLAEAVTKKVTVTIADFFSSLEKHDWYTSFSDSSEVNKRGEIEFHKLDAIASKHPEFTRLLKAFNDHHFTGEAWGNEKQPKPLLETFENVSVDIEQPVESRHGILIRSPGEDGRDNNVWDNTSNADGHCLVKEVWGQERCIGVFPNRDVAIMCAEYAVSVPDGGYDDVVIESVKVYNTFEEWFL